MCTRTTTKKSPHKDLCAHQLHSAANVNSVCSCGQETTTCVTVRVYNLVVVCTVYSCAVQVDHDDKMKKHCYNNGKKNQKH